VYQHQAKKGTPSPEDKMIRNYVASLSPAVFLAPSEQLPNSLPPWLDFFCNEPTFFHQIGQTPCS